MRWKIAVLPVLTVLLMACEGPVGPQGPAGPAGATGATGAQGEPGVPGSGTRLVLGGRVATDGSAVGVLPAAAGTMSDPPSLVCYLGETLNGPYLQISTDFFVEVSCGLMQSGGRLHAAMTGAVPGWYYRFVVIH